MALKEALLNDFSGGLNQRDAPSEIADNETPDCLNVTLNERGGVEKRLGFVAKIAPFLTAFPPQVMFEWIAKKLVFTQCGPLLFKDASTASFGNFASAAAGAFCEFGDACYVVHPVDGLFKTTDGITFLLIAGAPKGSCIAAWQGRLIVAGDPDNPTTLYGSAIDDGTDFTTAEGHGWTNKLDDIDSQPIVSLIPAPGVDIAGNPGLIACKNRSTYRVNDPNSGAYQLLDASIGTANAHSVTSTGPWVYTVTDTGIYRTDGVSALVEMSGRVRPMFQPSQIAYDQLPLYRAQAAHGRVHFSFPKAGSAANNIHLEHHPDQGWIVPHTDAMASYLTSRDGTETLYGGSPTVPGQVYQLMKGGNDDGADIASRYQTKWISPVGGIEAVFRRVRVFGRGTLNLYVKLDYTSSDGDLNAISLIGDEGVWDQGTWDESQWSPANAEASADFYSLGKGSAISFTFAETGNVGGISPFHVVDGLPSPDAGVFAVYALLVQFVPIGV